MAVSVKDLRKQYNSLVTEREQILPIWKELSNNFLPLKRVLLDEDKTDPEEVYNQLGEVNKNILDSTPIKGTRVLGAGMQSGVTSPAKRWFRLGHSTAEIERIPAVKEWLDTVQKIIFNIMSRSNFYNSTHNCYLEVSIFGTLVLLILEDDDKVIRTLSLSAGSYVLAANFKNIIDTLYRRFFMTASQIVDQFGEENASMQVKNAYNNTASKGKWFSVIHCVKPNPDFDARRDDIASMRYISVYFEESPADDSINKELNRSGFREQPFIAARWDVTGESVYGDSPAMDVLAFAKQLQSMTSSLLKAKQKSVDPPLNVPPNMKSVSTAPGALNYIRNVNEKIEPTLNVGWDTQDTQATILDVRQQILEGLFNDIFRALALSPSDKMTATEVLERVSEGLRLLGPVLERLQFEFLDPVIDRIFAVGLRNDLFPPAPIELEGEELRIEYISPLAQAQKAVGTDALTQLFQFTLAIAQANPEILDNVNFDEMLRIYSELIGVSPKVLNDDSEIEALREQRAVQQAAMLAQQQTNQDLQNLKTMSETQVTPDANAIEAVGAATES
jgi:hypothetical protein